MTRAAVTCAAPCCRAPIEQGKLLCAAHWFALPERLRNAIGATWRARHVSAFQELWTEALVILDPAPRPFDPPRQRGTTPMTIAYEGSRPVVYATGRLL
ncbi:hypothetical protein [Sphingopyxis sp. GW247-27LB]|uniref:hypothetical protein n=1 Tax=Sphingopyxis sp. GW247-27LB TaxID=2012632 RepID=UPI000BA781C5|nr:hypothetical protein [Sphingopyxis sp. GW247-27LB]PAL25512.1 hypothetical protein CD928_03295 [Sphingopyxis sp. GW247-27LB]